MKADHARDPTEDHSQFTTDPVEIANNMEDVGLGLYVSAEADDEMMQSALGPQVDDATLYAASVKVTTESELKNAQKAVKSILKAEMPKPKPKWNPRAMKTMNSTWTKESNDLGQATILSTSQIPASVSIPHVATGAVAPNPRKRGAAAQGSGSVTNSKKARKESSEGGSSA